jgi:hypothetical protein
MKPRALIIEETHEVVKRIEKKKKINLMFQFGTSKYFIDEIHDGLPGPSGVRI